MEKKRPKREFDLEDWDREQELRRGYVSDPEDDEDEDENALSFTVEVREITTKYVTVFADDAEDAMSIAEMDLKRYDFAGSADKVEQSVVGIVVSPGKTVRKGASGVWTPFETNAVISDYLPYACPACQTLSLMTRDEVRKPGPITCWGCGSNNYFMHQDWMDGTEDDGE